MTDFSGDDADETDVNGVSVPVDDSEYKKATDQTIEKGDNKFDFAKKRKGSQKWGEESEHKKGARPSTQRKHEKGQSRKGKDKGGEKGDDRRPYRNK